MSIHNDTSFVAYEIGNNQKEREYPVLTWLQQVFIFTSDQVKYKLLYILKSIIKTGFKLSNLTIEI